MPEGPFSAAPAGCEQGGLSGFEYVGQAFRHGAPRYSAHDQTDLEQSSGKYSAAIESTLDIDSSGMSLRSFSKCLTESGGVNAVLGKILGERDKGPECSFAKPL